MPPTMPGLHHVTAITADAQANVDFYCGTLGLRLVKLTVNFDDPTSYHLYYGDEGGRPGTILTFFAWPGARRGHVGPPQATVTGLAVPASALGYWADRLADRGVATRPGEGGAGEPVLGLDDPDGMALELVAAADPGGRPPTGGPIPAEVAIRGLHGVTLAEGGHEATARLLTDVMGYRAWAAAGNRTRFVAAGGGPGSVVDLLCVPGARPGRPGAGVVHHVAFRTPDDDQQHAWRRQVVALGRDVSPVMDRSYFRSIYFREPGGVLFEVATDRPGFAVDEPADRLGSRLMLPAEFEPRRAELEHILPPLRLPTWHPTPGGTP